MTENCTSFVNLPMRPSEKERLRKLAGEQSIAAYLRNLVNTAHKDLLTPSAPGRHWPENPAERRLRTRESNAA
jgi:hypothetical protein